MNTNTVLELAKMLLEIVEANVAPRNEDRLMANKIYALLKQEVTKS